jgi:signal transduction histidine kinase/ligand-binding sensor domain-containing protein/DNA-binding response OmpR family regulator
LNVLYKITEFLLIIVTTINTYGQKLHFEHFTVENGLQNNIVFATTEDAKGLIWFATSTGVDRFDGTNFLHYEMPQKNNTSTKYSQVPYILTDGKKQLWAASATNIYFYNLKKDRFELPVILNNWFENNKTITGLFPSQDTQLLLIAFNNGLAVYHTENQSIVSTTKFNKYVRCLYQDTKGLVWAGTNKGLHRFIINKSDLNEWTESTAVLNILKDKLVTNITQDRWNRYWIATVNDGIFLYNETDNSVRQVVLPKTTGRMYTIKDIYFDTRSSNTYISLDGGGLVCYDSSLSVKAIYQTNEDDLTTLSNNAAYDIFKDNFERLWVTTYGGGVNVAVPEVQPFKNFSHEINNNNSLSNNAAKAIVQDAAGQLWFGTRKGISKLNVQTNHWQHFNEENATQQFTADNVLALVSDKKKYIYAGTYGGGLMQINTASNKIVSYKNNETDNNSLGTDYVYALCYDTKGRLWAGGIRGPLSMLNMQTNKFERIQTPVNSINCILEGVNGEILAGTEKGLYYVAGDKLENMFPKMVTEKVNTVLEYSPGTYWLGILGGGIMVVSKAKGVEKVYHATDGLPSDVICGMLKDDHGDVWIGSSKGITHYQIRTHSFTTYTKADGLAGSQVNYGAVFQTQNGQMIFGTTDGFSMFDPNSIRAKGFTPNIVFTNITINNKIVTPNTAEGPLNVQIDEIERLTLKYFQNSFSIDFINTSPAVSGKHLYSWKLDGFDKEWSQPSTIPIAVYTNIPSGSYTLLVKAFSKGQEEKATMRKLGIRIKAPWWRTGWAFLAYLILLAAGINIWYSYYKIVNARRKFAERLRLNTNISHEIRTPLTLIKGPVNALSNATGITDEQKDNLELAKKNIQKLETIIAQFIDFQKTGSDKLQMQVQQADILSLLDEVTSSFVPLMKEKNIHFTYKRPSEKMEILFDKEKMEKVLNNLLSNAVKYTPVNRDIEVTVVKDKTNVQISVADTGIGIPASEQQFLFKGYFRANNTINLKETGSGIGLIVVKEMIEMHHGKLSLATTQHKGTTFTIRLPLQNESLRPFLIKESGPAAALYFPEIKDPPVTKKSNKRIVIAEDNDELRNYLKNELQVSGYKVTAAANGKEALQIIQKNGADLIITDVMMPEMDGFQLCTAIKKDVISCHIPLIMLTAIHDKDYLLEGYRSGADDYVRKPFDIAYILVRIENLLQNRTRFQNKLMSVFEQEEQVVKEDVEMSWLKNTTQMIADNIANPDFSVEKLATLMLMSRPAFFRKFKAIANEVPQQYIIQVRLRYAVELLQKGTNNISEVAYMVGFEDPKYFSTAFKKHFGKSPREYMQSADSG